MDLQDVDQTTVRKLANELQGQVNTQSLSRTQVSKMIGESPDLKAIFNQSRDSQPLVILDRLFKNNNTPSIQQITGALEKAGLGADDVASVTNQLSDGASIADTRIVRRLLESRGLNPAASKRVLNAVGDVASAANRGGIGRQIGRGISKAARSIGAKGGAAMIGTALTIAGGPALEAAEMFLEGTPMGNGEMPKPGDPDYKSTILGMERPAINTVPMGPLTESRTTGMPEDLLTSHEESRLDTRRGRRQANRDSDRVLEMAREMERDRNGEAHVRADSSSPTSGNSNILATLSSLMGQ